MTLADQIRTARIKKGLSQAALAEAVGISQPAIRKIEAGETQKSRYLTEIVQFLGLQQATPGSEIVNASQDYAPVVQSEMPRDVPVFGVVVGGEDAEFYTNGDVIDRVRRPPGVSGARSVYALYVIGTSMAPRFEEGELIYVNADRAPAIGDYAVIELHPREGERAGRGFVKRLKQRSGDKIVCEQFNPPAEICFDRKDVKNLHRIIPWSELLGA